MAGGVAGAAVGFAATLLGTVELVGFGNRADPIGSALLLMLLVFAPAGGIAPETASGSQARDAAARRREHRQPGRQQLEGIWCADPALRRRRHSSSLSTRSRLPRPGSTRTPPPRFSKFEVRQRGRSGAAGLAQGNRN